MNAAKMPADKATGEAEMDLDVTGLLGSSQVFGAGVDPALRAEMIDANCNKIGTEGCEGPPPPP